MWRWSHSSISLSEASCSAATKTASSTLGRVALAKASARIVGLCSLETSTMACTRVGSTGSSSPTTSSSATRS